MNDRILEAIKNLKGKQDDLTFELKQLARDFEKSSSINMQESILKVADDLARYTIQDGYWYYNGKDTGIKAEGIDGKEGPQGIQGIPGKDGKDGKPGKDGKDGVDGKDGKPGLNGKDGKPGKDGKNGVDGKDGITPLIKIGKVEFSDTYGGGDVKMRFGKGNIIYLDFKLPMGRQGFAGLDGKDAKINGKNTIELKAGKNITIKQEGETLTISAKDSGGGGSIKTLTEDDYDYPVNNPTSIAGWLLDPDYYMVEGTNVAISKHPDETHALYFDTGDIFIKLTEASDNITTNSPQYIFTQRKNNDFEYYVDKDELGTILKVSNVIDNLTTPNSYHPLSAKQGKILNDKIDEVYGATMVYNTLPKITGNSDTIDNTSNTPMELELLPSELEQVTTTGKNLFDINKTPTWTGSNTSYNVDGETLKVEGDWFIGITVNVNPNTYYYLSRDRNIIEQHGVTGRINIYTEDRQTAIATLDNNGSFNSGNNSVLYVLFYSGSGTSGSVEFSNIQLEEGNTATSYEPYTNGASPNPDYPQEIHTVTGDNEVDIVGKNLFNLLSYYETTYDSGATVNKIDENNIDVITNGAYAYQRVYYKMLVKPNKDYTFKASISNSNSDVTNNWIMIRDEIFSNTSIINDSYTSGNVINFNSGNNNYIIIGLYGTTRTALSNTASYRDIQLVEGEYTSSTMPEYTPYQSQTYPITLGNLEYCKIGDYSDEFVKQEDKWYLKKNVGKVVLDGSESWSEYLTSVYLTTLSNIVSPTATSDEGLILSNNYETTTQYKINNNQVDYGITIRVNQPQILIKNKDITTTDNFKSWLSTHNTLVYYILETPEYILLNDTLQTELNNIQKAVSYNEQTNIIQVNDDLPFIINYSANKNVPTKLSELENDSGYVKDTDYSGNTKAGVNKTNSYWAVATQQDTGYIFAQPKTYSQYESGASEMFISKGTLENVITGKGLTNVAHTNSNNNFSTAQTINGNLTVVGDISQTGSQYETHAEQLFTKNDLIKTRDGAVGGLGNNEVTGIEAIKYDGTNNGRLVFDNTGTARVGDVGDEVPLLARDESSNMTDGKVLTWDGTNLIAKTTIGFVTLTQAQYDALATKDANTYYFIEEE